MRAAIWFRPAVVILLVCVLVLGCKKGAQVAKSVSRGTDLSLFTASTRFAKARWRERKLQFGRLSGCARR